MTFHCSKIIISSSSRIFISDKRESMNSKVFIYRFDSKTLKRKNNRNTGFGNGKEYLLTQRTFM
jgi:hypothetical protein